MYSISCENLSLSFGSVNVLDSISFSLNDGERLGIIGVNGAGKTSLFKLISGEYTPDPPSPGESAGNIYIARGYKIGTLSQIPDFDESDTLLSAALSSFHELLKDEAELERLRLAIEASASEKKESKCLLSDETELAERYAAMLDRFNSNGGFEFRGRARGILKNLGFGENLWELPVSSLSGGQKTRLALACLLLRNDDILLLDEPTNHLDTNAMYWLEDYLKSSRKTVLVISHDRYFLDSIATKILEIENTKGTLYEGNYFAARKKKEANRSEQEKHYKNQQREIARIEAYIEQQRRWNREHNIIAAESRQKMLNKMQRVERPDAEPKTVRLKFMKSGESGHDVLQVRSVSHGYPGKPLFENLSFTVKKRERIFIAGPNGCGKSTLIKLIAGAEQPDSGEIEYGSNVEIGYYDQENHQLDESKTVLDELWDAYPDLTQTELRSALALFLFKGDDVSKRVSMLSGGERSRLTLTKLILSKINLLILDEPTNHLDIGSREALEGALEEFAGTVIAVSHDRYFINKLATRVLDFDIPQPLSVFDYSGGWEEYREYKAQYLCPAEEDREVLVTRSKEEFLLARQKQSEQRRRERRIKLNSEETELVEIRLTEISLEMNGEASTDHVLLAKLYSEHLKLEARLLELYEEAECLLANPPSCNQ